MDDELRKAVILKLGYIRFEQGLEAWQRVERDVMELIAQERAKAAREALEKVQDEIVLHYYDTTVGRKIEEFILAELQSQKSGEPRKGGEE